MRELHIKFRQINIFNIRKQFMKFTMNFIPLHALRLNDI